MSAAFFAAYERQLRGMARALLRRWRLPAAVTEDDVYQELRLGAWQAWQRWRVGRGAMTREAYAICSARLHTQRWLHEQRGAVRRSGKSPSRFPIHESALEHAVDRVIEPGQDLAVEFADRLRAALRACLTDREKLAMEALMDEQFDPDAAVLRLYGDVQVRRIARLGSRVQAREAVRRAVRLMEEA